MRFTRRRIFRVFAITALSLVILLTAAGFILSAVLTKKVSTRLEAVNAKFGSLRINLFTRGIRIRDFEWSPKADTLGLPDSLIHRPHQIVISDIHATGVDIIKLIRTKEVSLNKIQIEDGRIFINREFKGVQNNGPKKPIPLKSLGVEKIIIDGINFQMGTDSLTEYQANVSIELTQISLDSVASFQELSAYKLKNIETTVRNLKLSKTGSLFEFGVYEAYFNKELQRLRIDSLYLNPLLDNNAFAKRVKSQQTNTKVSVARIEGEGLNMAVHLEDTSLMVKLLTITDPVVYAYKDKRYPFTRKEKIPLPMALFRELPFSVEVDSIKIDNGEITYEEFPEEGFHTGKIAFEKLDATMSSVNNREFKNLAPYATLRAKAHLMKTGEIEAVFKLPLEKDKLYSATGTIKNVPLRELNPFLRHIAFIEISSGRINRMAFDFSYDDIGSKGLLRFDYEDLKILALKKERGGDVKPFMTALVNTAVKNDRELSGGISVERNQKKAVFNLWAISILDGVKSALLPAAAAKATKKKKK